MKMLGIVVCVNEDILLSCVNVFFLRQRNFYYTYLKGLKVSIDKKVKAETIEYYILTSNKGFVGIHIIIYIIK